MHSVEESGRMSDDCSIEAGITEDYLYRPNRDSVHIEPAPYSHCQMILYYAHAHASITYWL